MEKVNDFQEKMDDLQTGIRIPKTAKGLFRAHTEAGISWNFTYAEALQIYACMSLMLGLLASEDKYEFIEGIDTSAGLNSLPMLPAIYEDLTQLMYKEQRRVLADEDN
jgi:hypothetical protein